MCKSNTAPSRNNSGVRKRGRPSNYKSRKLKENILKIATKEFIRWGYEAAKIDRIAKGANVSRITIYRNFTSKENLFRAATIRVNDRVGHDFAEVKQAGRPVREVIRDFATLSFDDPASEEMLGLTRILIAESNTFPDLVYTAYQNRRMMLQPLTNYLRHMSELGELHFNSDPELAAFQLVALASGGIRAFMIPREAIERSRELWIEAAVEVFLNGTLPNPGKHG